MTSLASLNDRLACNSYHLDEEQNHIEVNQEVARRTGAGQLLMRICPAGVYGEAADGTITVNYAACLECGTCRAVAAPGVLGWHYPRGGFGIAYREG